MARFCVDISHLTDENLEFFGYQVVSENEEFKVYTDKNLEDHLVRKSSPLLYVEDINDAVYMSAISVVALPDDID
jgi:hypothetical protein